MKKTRIVSFIIALSSSSFCYGDFVGLNIGSSYWTPDLVGTVNSSSASNNINVNGSIESQPSFAISFEHPVPLIPNVKYLNRDLNSSGTDSVTGAGVTFNGETFNGSVTSNLDLSHNDLVLYYELLDNWVNLDLGLNLKKFDGQVSVRDSDSDEKVGIDETIPLIYLSARFDLPFTGFYVGADIQNVSLIESTAEDSTLMVGYETSSGFGIEGGYKKFNLNLDDASEINTTIEYDGLFLNGYFHF